MVGANVGDGLSPGSLVIYPRNRLVVGGKTFQTVEAFVTALCVGDTLPGDSEHSVFGRGVFRRGVFRDNHFSPDGEDVLHVPRGVIKGRLTRGEQQCLTGPHQLRESDRAPGALEPMRAFGERLEISLLQLCLHFQQPFIQPGDKVDNDFAKIRVVGRQRRVKSLSVVGSVAWHVNPCFSINRRGLSPFDTRG